LGARLVIAAETHELSIHLNLRQLATSSAAEWR
jgi:hypothetical protein